MLRPIPLLASAAVSTLIFGCASAPPAPPAARELTGSWTLTSGPDSDLPGPDRRGEEDDDERGPGSGRVRGGSGRPGGGGPPMGGLPGMGGRGGGGRPGGGAPGMGRGGDPEEMRAAMVVVRALMAPHRTLEVLRADSALSLRWDARVLEIPLDGEARRMAWEGLEDGIEVEARWEDAELVLERKAGDVTVVERWAHAPGSTRLVVDVEVKGPLARERVVRRIYDRAPGGGH